MYKETDLTHIKCEKCQNPITYEYVSFQGGTCTIGKQHSTQYAIKCSRCKKGYGHWMKFDISLFPGFSDPDKCPCRELCHYCGYNESSDKCCGRDRIPSHKNPKLQGSNALSSTCIKPEPVVEPDVKEWVPINKRKYGLFSLENIMKTMLTPLKEYPEEKKNIFVYESKESRDKLNLKSLEYPFSFIKDNIYKPESICTGLVIEEPIKPGDFPNNIVEYYWIHEGENDGMGDDGDWHLFCKIKTEDSSEAYVYYTASCNYTGFDCQGSMRMYISRNASALLDSLNKSVQDLLMKAKGICMRQNSDVTINA